MVKPIILDEQPLTLNEMKKEMKSIRDRDVELDIRSEKTEDYLKRIKMLTQKEEKDLIKELEDAQISRFKDEHIKKIVNTLPADVEEVKEVLKSFIITIKKEDMEKIAKIVKKYVQ